MGVSVLGETGYDLNLWETAKRHASWTRLAPRVARSGGKDIKMKHSRLIMPRIGRLFLQAAVAARDTETMIGAKYRRLRKRKSGNVAAQATAHDLQGKFYRMVKEKKSYQEIYVAERKMTNCLCLLQIWRFMDKDKVNKQAWFRN